MKPENCAAVFDMDGVLADTEQAHYESWQAIARRYGIEISWEKFHETFGQPNRQIIPQFFDEDIATEDVDRIDREKEAAFRAIVGDAVRPLPGARELVNGLDEEGFRLAIGSSGPIENIEAIAKALGLRERFEAVVGAQDVEKGKPAPDVFLKAADRLGVPPERCVVIEDVPAGVQAALAAGMKCIAVTNTHDAQALDAADRVVESLEEIDPADLRKVLGTASGAGA